MHFGDIEGSLRRKNMKQNKLYGMYEKYRNKIIAVAVVLLLMGIVSAASGIFSRTSDKSTRQTDSSDINNISNDPTTNMEAEKASSDAGMNIHSRPGRALDVENSEAQDTDAVTDKDNTPPGNPLDFADQELANCVIKQAGFKESAQPTDQLCASILELDTTGHTLTTLEDLAYFTNLEKLTVNNQGNGLNLKGINKATSLKSLTLCNCQLSEVDRIAELTDLEYLDLSSSRETYVQDYSSLAALTNLKSLNLRWDGYNAYNPYHLVDGSFINHLNALEELDIYETGIENYSLEGLSNLKRLTISECDMDNILGQLEISGALEKLEYLNTTTGSGSNNVMTYLTDDGMRTLLSKAVSLQELRGFNINNLTTLEGIEQLKALKQLELDNYLAFSLPLSEYSRLSGLIGLEELRLTGEANMAEPENHPDDFQFLSGLAALKRLEVRVYKGMSISCFADLTNLEILNLIGNVQYPIDVDIADISKLTSLKQLNYSGVRFKSSAPLDDLTELKVQEFGLGGCPSLFEIEVA